MQAAAVDGRQREAEERGRVPSWLLGQQPVSIVRPARFSPSMPARGRPLLDRDNRRL